LQIIFNIFTENKYLPFINALGNYYFSDATSPQWTKIASLIKKSVKFYKGCSYPLEYYYLSTMLLLINWLQAQKPYLDTANLLKIIEPLILIDHCRLFDVVNKNDYRAIYGKGKTDFISILENYVILEGALVKEIPSFRDIPNIKSHNKDFALLRGILHPYYILLKHTDPNEQILNSACLIHNELIFNDVVNNYLIYPTIESLNNALNSSVCGKDCYDHYAIESLKKLVCKNKFDKRKFDEKKDFITKYEKFKLDCAAVFDSSKNTNVYLLKPGETSITNKIYYGRIYKSTEFISSIQHFKIIPNSETLKAFIDGLINYKDHRNNYYTNILEKSKGVKNDFKDNFGMPRIITYIELLKKFGSQLDSEILHSLFTTLLDLNNEEFDNLWSQNHMIRNDI